MVGELRCCEVAWCMYYLFQIGVSAPQLCLGIGTSGRGMSCLAVWLRGVPGRSSAEER